MLSAVSGVMENDEVGDIAGKHGNNRKSSDLVADLLDGEDVYWDIEGDRVYWDIEGDRVYWDIEGERNSPNLGWSPALEIESTFGVADHCINVGTDDSFKGCEAGERC